MLGFRGLRPVGSGEHHGRWGNDGAGVNVVPATRRTAWRQLVRASVVDSEPASLPASTPTQGDPAGDRGGLNGLLCVVIDVVEDIVVRAEALSCQPPLGAMRQLFDQLFDVAGGRRDCPVEYSLAGDRVPLTHAVDQQTVEVHVQPEFRAEALHNCVGTCTPCDAQQLSGPLAIPPLNEPLQDGENVSRGVRLCPGSGSWRVQSVSIA